MLADVSLWCPRTFRAGMARSMPAVVSRPTAFAPPLMSYTLAWPLLSFGLVRGIPFPSSSPHPRPAPSGLLSPHSRCYHQTTNRLSLLLFSRRVEQVVWGKPLTRHYGTSGTSLFKTPPQKTLPKNISARLRHACLRHSHSGAGVGGSSQGMESPYWRM